MALKQAQEKVNFISILSSDATLRKSVTKEEYDAYLGTKEIREYEDSKGNKGTKYEYIYESVSGKITNIAFVDTDFGTLLQVTLSDFPNEDEILSMSTSQPYGEDFMKKLPNINLAEEVTIRPYSFIPDGKDKERRGVTVMQHGNKLTNFFYDVEAKKEVHGFPTPDGDTKSFKGDDWKIYFLQVRKFLTKYTQEHFASKPEETVDDLVNKMQVQPDNVDVSEIPF